MRAVLAVADNGAFGLDGKIPWTPPPGDMAHFVAHTTGTPVIVGARTWAGLPTRARERLATVAVIFDGQDAQALAEAFPQAVVIGGAHTFEAFAPYITTWIVTHIPGAYHADTFIPAWWQGLPAKRQGVAHVYVR